ncbi:hypothetical protein ACRRTK_019393 [Alexandromys fortis]
MNRTDCHSLATQLHPLLLRRPLPPKLPTLPLSKKRVLTALIRTARKVDPEAHVLRGEGFKTIAATRYETIMAMSSLAIINCQLYGRNALNLKDLIVWDFDF